MYSDMNNYKKFCKTFKKYSMSTKTSHSNVTVTSQTLKLHHKSIKLGAFYFASTLYITEDFTYTPYIALMLIISVQTSDFNSVRKN